MYSPSTLLTLIAVCIAGIPSQAMANAEDRHQDMVPRAFTLPDGTTATAQINSRFPLSITPRSATTTTSGRGSKRLSYTPGSPGDYCGETYPNKSFNPDDPAQVDCNAIAGWAASTSGYFTLTASDCGADRWCRIVTAGSCAFAIRFTGNGADTRIGTNDIRFYTETYARDAQAGRIRVEGGVACTSGNGNDLVILNWGLIRP